jgi:hypothetical protein
LLPNYDEYISAYKDHSAILDASHTKHFENRNNDFFHFLVIDGQIVGTWKRRFKKDTAFIDISPFIPLNDAQYDGIAAAAKRFSSFLGKSITVGINGATVAQISTD